MQMTMRWFGPDEDKVTLEQIRQVPGWKVWSARCTTPGWRSLATGEN